jgi:hypothetical protein
MRRYFNSKTYVNLYTYQVDELLYRTIRHDLILLIVLLFIFVYFLIFYWRIILVVVFL